MAINDYNILLDSEFTYQQYAPPVTFPTSVTNVSGDVSIVTTINGATGPSITIDGGSTGLAFSTGSSTIVLSGTLIAVNGGTGQSSYTKGDLLAAANSTQLDKLPVGANGSVLTADSAEVTGMRWGAPQSAELDVTSIDFTDSPYSLTDANDVLLVDATGGAVTVNLPNGTTAYQKTYYIKKVDATANAVTIDADGAQLIDGSGTQATTTQYDTFSIIPDNATGNWSIV